MYPYTGRELIAKTIKRFTGNLKEWYKLGIQLEIQYNALESIDQNIEGKDAIEELAHIWFNKDLNPTWAKLTRALTDIGYTNISDKIIKFIKSG